MRTTYVLLTVLTVCALAYSTTAAQIPGGQDAGFAAPWRDGEIRTERSAPTVTNVYLGIIPTCPHGQPTIVFRGSIDRKASTPLPAEIEVRISVGLNVDPDVIRTPTLFLVISSSIAQSQRLDLSRGLRSPLGPMYESEITTTGIADIPLADFMRMVSADGIVIDPFNLGSCVFAPPQRDALRTFWSTVVSVKRGSSR